MAELTPAERATVTTAAHTVAGSGAAYGAMTAVGRARTLAAALRSFRPVLVLGDPELINTGPRSATDTANIATLVTSATALIGLVMAPAATAHLGDVFGAANVASARACYAAAAGRLAYLHTNGSDRHRSLRLQRRGRGRRPHQQRPDGTVPADDRHARH
ncbi:hypothetical protein AB0C29_15755 [Actinoplanes sp. NPDC048791]|uniref:hypothetical protein n=1 Tax=Actinoplanes sp. NPDC048791 TaxID=3154623 RepID=UPI0033EE4942